MITLLSQHDRSCCSALRFNPCEERNVPTSGHSTGWLGMTISRRREILPSGQNCRISLRNEISKSAPSVAEELHNPGQLLGNARFTARELLMIVRSWNDQCCCSALRFNPCEERNVPTSGHSAGWLGMTISRRREILPSGQNCRI